MPKKKKLPKRPKISASLTAWENYHRKVADVEKYNRQLEADKKRKQTLINKAIRGTSSRRR